MSVKLTCHNTCFFAADFLLSVEDDYLACRSSGILFPVLPIELFVSESVISLKIRQTATHGAMKARGVSFAP